jgi:hypothetical protein
MARRFLLLFVPLFLFGCQDEPGPLDPPMQAPDGLFEISDARHSEGNPNFFWLPPLVKQPLFTGQANMKLGPEIRICGELGAQSCASGDAVAEFGPEIEVDGEAYKLDWDTKSTDLVLEQTYRIWVIIGSQDIGFADVLVAANGRDAKKAGGETFGLVDGRTLPLRFRLQVGVTLAGLDVDVDCNVADCAEFTATNEPFDECTDGGAACLTGGEGWLPEGFEEVTVVVYEVERDEVTGECFGEIGFLPQREGCYSINTFPDLGGAEFQEGGVVFTMCQDPDLPPYYVIHQRTSSGEIRIPETVLGIEPPGGRFCDPGTQIGMARFFEWARPVTELFFPAPLNAADGLAARLTSFSDFFYAPGVSVAAVDPIDEADAESSELITFRVMSDHHGQTPVAVAGVAVEFAATAGTLDTASGESDADGYVTVLWTLPGAAGPATLTAVVPVLREAHDGTQPTASVVVDVIEEELFSVITGFVTQSDGTEFPPPLPGATVSIPSLGLSTLTNADGFYSLPAVPVGVHTVQASSVGYETQSTEGVLVSEGGSQLVLHFQLAPLTNTLTFIGTDPEVDPESDATVVASDASVTVAIDYSTSAPYGVHIWALPYTDGQFTPGMSYQGSTPLFGAGSVTRTFQIFNATPPVEVNQIRILMQAITEEDQLGDILEDFLIPVNFVFMDEGQ